MRYNGVCICLLLMMLMFICCAPKQTDEAIASDIQAKVAADRVTQDSQVAVEVVEGKVTLRGKAKTQEARQRLELIAKNSSGVTAVDDLTTVEKAKPAEVAEAPPPPPPIVVPAGTVLTIRTNQALGSKISRAGSAFTGSLLNPVRIEGKLVIPAGTDVIGTVVKAKKAGRWKGGATLALSVRAITLSGQTYGVATEMFAQQSTGKGKRTAAMIGGGTGAGAAIGGVAGGGKGAAIGAVTGAAAGTIGALTGNRDISLPAESQLNFRLTQPLTLKPEVPGAAANVGR